MSDLSIAFVGDIMPGGLLHYKKDDFIGKEVFTYFQSFDLRVGTLECALADDFVYYYGLLDEKGKQKNIVYAKSIDIEKVKKLNIDVVTIANNHIYDLGKEGLINTISVLKENGIKFCGAGLTIGEASKPVIVNKKGVSVAFIGCSEQLGTFGIASENKPGINLLEIDRIAEDIKVAKKEHDYVFVLPHWGIEHAKFPPYYIKLLAEKMIASGADGVFGSHSHSVQPHYYFQNKPIFFSMGNFLFPSRINQPPSAAYYPESIENLHEIPISRTAKCATVSIKTWRPTAKLAMIVSVVLSKNIRATVRLTELSNNFVIGFLKGNRKLYNQIAIFAFSIKHCPKPFYFTHYILKKTRNRVK